MNSLWLNNADFKKFPCLNGEHSTDVLIIGGGLCGILCANELKKLGVDYMLVERDRIFRKTSGNTTAKITSQHNLIYSQLTKKFGSETAEKYYHINEKAVSAYSELCKNIDCDFSVRDNYIYSLTSIKKLSDEMNALQAIKASASFTDSLPTLPFDVLGAIRFPHQAQFNPVAFSKALADELNIFENSPILSFDGKYYCGENFKVKAEKVIVTTHFPLFNKHGAFSLKLYQHRSYVIALRNAGNVNGMYLDENSNGLSFRNQGDYLLLGGGSHRTGKNTGGYKQLRETAKSFYKNSTEAFHWAAQDCMTLDGLPYIGQYSKRTPDLFVATGFNKWGMTLSMVSAIILKDLIFGKESDYSSIFSPSRSVFHPQLMANAFESTVGLLTPTKPRCPHLGCALKWNKQEHSWDCSCHGSRFAENGALLDNPANADLKTH